MTSDFHTKNGNAPAWTKTEDMLLKQMVIEGKYYQEICETIGRTRASCISRARRLNIARLAPNKKIGPVTDNPETVEKVVKAWREGHTTRQICAMHGMPAKTTVQLILRRFYGDNFVQEWEVKATKLGKCKVSGQMLYKVFSPEHEHIVPELIVKLAIENKRAWVLCD